MSRLTIQSKLYINLDAHPRNAILLCGSARSGTTWVAELISHSNRFRYMFEPFSRSHVEACRSFNVRQYIRPNSRDPRYVDVVERILSGRIRHPWIDRYNKKVVCRRRLIKDIRANLMLKWMRTSFPETRIVFLLRHPCAVALSRSRQGWDTHLQEVLSQDELVADYLSDHVDDIQAATNVFEKHIYLWCIENIVPLRQFKNDEALILFYEDLCTEPESVVSILYRWLGLGSEGLALNKIARPSVMTLTDSAVNTGEDLIGSWRAKLDTARLDRAGQILERFSLDGIYSVDVEPRTRDPLACLAREGE